MPIGFSDLLKTTAQLDNNLTKGIVNTDETYGGVRSKIDDWTDLHLSTFNGGAGRTFQDDGTAASPGHFKPYSTLFYVADGRALIETNTAEGAIRLNSSGEFVSSGGQLYTHDPSGTAEPEYWVYIDATATGGSGTGTDKLPKFTITGTQGGGSTVLPAGYQKLQVLTNAVADPGGSGFNSTIGVDTDLTTTGVQVIDTISLTDGVVVSNITTRNLTLSDFGVTSTAAELNILDGVTSSTAELNILDGVTSSTAELNILDGVTSSTAELNILDGVTSSTAELNILDGVTATAAEINILDGVTSTTAELNILDGVTSTTAELNILDGVTATTAELNILDGVTATAAELNLLDGATANTVVNSKAVIYGAAGEIAASSVTISGNLSVAGTVTQSNSQEVNFNDTRLRLNIPTGLLDGSIENTAAPTADTNVGLEIFNGATGGAFSNGPLWVYNYNTDKWGASIQGSETTLDNVTAMKFDRTLTGLATDNADIADLYGNSASAVSNDETARSLGGVSRCRITITTESTDGVNNFAPVTAAAVGYPIKHNLGTKAVFVVAIKDPDGTPIPVHCKYEPKTTNVCVVSVGITAEDEVYDIIVIG